MKETRLVLPVFRPLSKAAEPTARAAVGEATFVGTVQAGHFLVDDILSRGQSYRALVGAGPPLVPIPLSAFASGVVFSPET